MSKIYSDRFHSCDWCGPCEADLNFLTDWPGQYDDDGTYRDLKVCDICLKEQDIQVPYEPAPLCKDCSATLSDRDRLVFEREGGSGWPRVCEDCAEKPMSLEEFKSSKAYKDWKKLS